MLCYQVEVSALGWSLVRRSPTECGVSNCDRETSLMEALAYQRLFGHGGVGAYLIIWRYKNHNKTELLFLLYSSEEDVRVIGDELCKYFIIYSLFADFIYCIILIQNDWNNFRIEIPTPKEEKKFISIYIRIEFSR